MSDLGTCVTHHACDCIQERMRRLEEAYARLSEAVREYDKGRHFGGLWAALEETDAALDRKDCGA